MRVWFQGMTYKEYKQVTHWEEMDQYWVELLDDDDHLVTVINWTHVLYMEPMR